MPHSHHSHSGQFCSHADPNSSLTKVVETADGLGFTHFGLSEHIPRELPAHLYPEELQHGLDPGKLMSIFRNYLSEAKRLQRKYQGGNGIKLLVGIETENIRTKEEDTQGSQSRSLDFLIELLESLAERWIHSSGPTSPTIRNGQVREEHCFPEDVGKGVVDYLVGSVHHVHEVPIDFDKSMLGEALQKFQKSTVQTSEEKTSQRRIYHRLVSAYLDAQYEVLQRLRPEVIGHLDLPFLFDPSNTWQNPDFHHQHSSEERPGAEPSEFPSSSSSALSAEEATSWQKLVRNVRFACSYGALFEINSAAFRKGWSTAYPSTYPLKLILSLSGRVCLSDDSHGIVQVGLNYLRSRDYLMDNKVGSIWYLQRSQEEANAGSEEAESYLKRRENLEKERLDRERSEAPGRGAPTAFRRGTVAKEMSNWQQGIFWDKLEERSKVVAVGESVSQSA